MIEKILAALKLVSNTSLDAAEIYMPQETFKEILIEELRMSESEAKEYIESLPVE